MAQTKTKTSHKSTQPLKRTASAMTRESDRLHSIRCHLQRLTRYHKARERFFSYWFNMLSFFTLSGGSAIVVSILTGAPIWVSLTAGTIVTVAQAIQQIGVLHNKTTLHSALASEFTSLERYLHMGNRENETDLDSICAEISSIEMREPPIKRYLDLICRNQVAQSIGSDDVEHISFWQKLFAQFLNGDSALQKGSPFNRKAPLPL